MVFDQLSCGGVMVAVQGKRKELIDKMGENLTEEQKGFMEEVLHRALDLKMPLKDAMGLNQQVFENIYNMAYQMYNTGRYQQSLQLFRLLVTLDISELKYLMGVAASLHMLKDYKGASELYFILATLNPHDPVPYYHAADCYLQLGMPDVAAAAMKSCIDECAMNPKFQAMKMRLEVMLEGLYDAHPQLKM